MLILRPAKLFGRGPNLCANCRNRGPGYFPRRRSKPVYLHSDPGQRPSCAFTAGRELLGRVLIDANRTKSKAVILHFQKIMNVPTSRLSYVALLLNYLDT